MSYARTLLMKDSREERKKLEEDMSRKGLRGSIGRTLGGLGAMILTGGAAAPLVAGLAAAGGTLAGGMAGSALGGNIKSGKFFKSDRKSAQNKLGILGKENLMGAVTSGLSAGVASGLKQAKAVSDAEKAFETANIGAEASEIAKAGEAAKFKGLDFRGSIAGKTKLGTKFADRFNIGTPLTSDTTTKVVGKGTGGISNDLYSNYVDQFFDDDFKDGKLSGSAIQNIVKDLSKAGQ